jgi:DNA polymerase I-like protein with 3'-5' exonuclease and polymerase domains
MVGPALTGRQEWLHLQHEKQVQAMNDSVADWRAPELPDLSAFDHIILDLETDGLRWWDQSRMIGAGLWTPDGRTRYLPIRHRGGQNLCEATFFRWCARELRGKRIVNIRTKFDLHMFRSDGIDLEAQGNTFGDVAHYAALLDDHRRLFNQADLVKAFLPEDTLAGKIVNAHGFELDPSKFKEYPAGLVAPRAENDVLSVALLQAAMWPRMTAEDLHRVREIEDAIIPVVVEMEHNGAPLNVETLARWVQEAQAALSDCLWEIRRATGVDMDSPNKNSDIQRIFNVLNLPYPCDVDTGQFSKADELLAPINHPVVQTLRRGIAIDSLLSKFLLKYQKSTLRDGILRYELHQLPYQDDEEGHGGAVSGRFSSAAPSRDEGANIQQVIGVKKQQGKFDKATGKWTGFTPDWIIKKLFKPDRTKHPRAVWMKADASQFQFRLFAHYGNSPRLIEAYRRDNDWRAIQERARAKLAAGEPLTKDDKLTDFHETVQEQIEAYTRRELNRTHTKNVNFAQVFGAGVRKMAMQIGVPADQIPAMDEPLESGGPLFQEVVKLSETYHEMFPEVKPLLDLTSHLAMPDHNHSEKRGCGPEAKHQNGFWARSCRGKYLKGFYHRGYVKTYLGRRARFNDGDRFYSALNRIIQGTEGDVNKRVLVEIHKMRQELGLTPRFTVHDELDADLHEPEDMDRVREVLNTQYYDFKVPILWEAGLGPSWAEAK